jgi:hypothetical protein
MRRFLPFLPVLVLIGTLFLAQPAAAQQTQRPDAPDQADVREYVRLFGYRQMLENTGAEQLSGVVEVFRQTRKDVAPAVLDIIHQEMKSELEAATDQAVDEMVAVFARRLSRDDVAFLIGVGRDPRMQKVIALQPDIARDMEGIGERLATRVAEKAGPKIEQRLRELKDAQQL